MSAAGVASPGPTLATWSFAPQRTRPRIPSSRGLGQDAEDAEVHELAAELEEVGGHHHSSAFFTVQHTALPHTHGLRHGPAPRPLGPAARRRRGGGGGAFTTSIPTKSAHRVRNSTTDLHSSAGKGGSNGGPRPRPRPASRGEHCWIALEVVVQGSSLNASTVSPVQHRTAQSAVGLRQRWGPTAREAFAGGNAGQFDGGFGADSLRAEDASTLLSFGREPPSPRTQPFARAWQHHSSHKLLGAPGEPESLSIQPAAQRPTQLTPMPTSLYHAGLRQAFTPTVSSYMTLPSKAPLITR